MEPTPDTSRRSSFNTRNLSLDLSSLPPLSQPAPPTNTLLFTNLQSLDVFRPDNLQTIRELVSKTAAVHTWSPLRSFRRIIVSFFSEQHALAVRQVWDGEAVLGERVRVYFGQPTPVDKRDEHLALPDAGKLFFISPPPSPPAEWEVRLEDAPNRMVHAEDLAEALARLHKHKRVNTLPTLESPTSAVASPIGGAQQGDGSSLRSRSRSSTLIYMPEQHEGSPVLPAIAVEDMTDEPEELSPVSSGKAIFAHTSRPPVALAQS